MFRPAIQSTRVLFFLAIFNLLVFIFASYSTTIKKGSGFEKKIKAAHLMEDALKVLKEHRLGTEGVFIDAKNDPLKTGLIGPQFSLITTDYGYHDYKITTLNPNFAALFVEFILEAKVPEGSKIAVSLTGSMPGANIALFSACKVLNLDPVIITSVGASQWGATDPYFTWLDMESVLLEKNIFNYKTVAASIGGKGDIGKGLSIRGRELLWEAIYRNEVHLIQADSLFASMERRIEVYEHDRNLDKYAAFINIGGGAASIGPIINNKLIPNGVSKARDLIGLAGRSVLREFSQNGVPIIHLAKIKKLTEEYDLPYAAEIQQKIGEGNLFSRLIYNIWISSFSLLLALGSLIFVGIYSHKQINHRMETYEPESIL